MPLTIPSTAWSSAQSSKTMFAALPPSSSVSFLPLPASCRWIAFPTSVEPARALLEDARDPEQILRALGARQRRPAVGEGAARCGHGAVDVLGRPLPHRRQRLLARRRDRLVRLRRLEPLTVDEVPVALLEPDDLTRLGRGRIHPLPRDGRAVLFAIEVSQR